MPRLIESAVDYFVFLEDVIKERQPTLREREALIRDTIGAEEERFGEVYRQGIERLEQAIEGADGDRLSGKQAFFLWDTIGFPFILTLVVYLWVRFTQRRRLQEWQAEAERFGELEDPDGPDPR